ncbi:MAG: TCR/Tet family MFS transporter [Phycisphaerales bacterium]
MRSHKPAIGFIFITLLLDVIGFGLLIPVAPRLIAELQGGPQETAAGTFGLLAATYAVMQFLCAPTLGALSDHFGRRPVLLVALFGSGLDYFALALSPTVPLLFISRAVNGISGASMTVASAYIADITPPEKRAAGFGIVGAAFGLGFILGPVIGGFLGDPATHLPLIGHGHVRLPFYAAGVLTLMNWLYGLLVVPESLPPERRARISFARANPVGVFLGFTRYPLVVGMAGAMFLLNLAQIGLHSTWALYTAHRFGWSPRQIGYSLAMVGICAAVVQAGLARKVIPLLGEKRALILGLAIGVLSYLGYGLATEGWMVYVVIAFGSLGGISMPAGQSLVTRAVRPDEQGRLQGAMTGLQSVAAIFGPLIATHAFEYFISDGAKPFRIEGASFFISAILAAMGWVVAAWAVNRKHITVVDAPAAATAPTPS